MQTALLKHLPAHILKTNVLPANLTTTVILIRAGMFRLVPVMLAVKFVYNVFPTLTAELILKCAILEPISVSLLPEGL
jgi:hypothetical protein